MKKVIINAVLVLFFSLKLTAQDKIFNTLSISENDLSTEQKIIFNKLKNQHIYKSFNFVHLNNIEDISPNGIFNLSLPFLNMQNIYLNSDIVEFDNISNYKWHGAYYSEYENDEFNYGSLYLNIVNGRVIGHFSFDELSYEIYDLQNGVQVFCETNMFPIHENNCSSNNNKIVTKKTRNNGCENIKTKILVLYTPAANLAEPDIIGKANLGISQLNTIWYNSKVNNYAELTGVVPINFIEDQNQANGLHNDVISLPNISSLTNLRTQYKADIVILLTSDAYGDFKGEALANGGGYNDAYAIVAVNFATSNIFTFAHEVNHIYGALHDSDPTPGFAHGFSFCTSKCWIPFVQGKVRNTLIKQVFSDQGRIEHLSNPDVKFLCKNTGDATFHNNAKKVSSFIDHVALLELDPDYLILGNLKIIDPTDDCIQLANATAEMTCGIAPFTYSWQKSFDGIIWTSFANNSNSATFNIPLPFPITSTHSNLKIKCKITDANNNTIELKNIANYYCPKGNDPKRLMNNNNIEFQNTILPNPNDGKFNLEFYQQENKKSFDLSL
jgi:Metallo-peptidase family M12B Reprolysin-like